MKKCFVNSVVFLVAVTAIGQTKPGVRAHHELAYDEKNEVVIMTAGSTPLNGGSSFEMYNDLWKFDGKAWKQDGTAGDKRSGIRMAYDSKRKKLFSFGGWMEGNSLPELRVMENGEWKTVSGLSGMKAAESGFVYDEKRDRLVTFGGSAARGVVNNITWEWDGSRWKQFEGKNPPGRQAFVMIYDNKREKIVLLGGMDGARNQFTDMWEFDGQKWDSIPVGPVNPGPRISAGYTYDSKRGLLLIFGGISGKETKSDTWSWNGKEWKQLATNGPAARTMGYLAYDKKRDRVVLFGGRLGWPNDANDTWEWDGIEWKEVK
ncbi:MAG: hypothetical protein JNN00_12300 [Chitinophagaceae bacterium]|nr:hypothetical protein [Chitinophagaceae bacterium]